MKKIYSQLTNANRRLFNQTLSAMQTTARKCENGSINWVTLQRKTIKYIAALERIANDPTNFDDHGFVCKDGNTTGGWYSSFCEDWRICKSTFVAIVEGNYDSGSDGIYKDFVNGFNYYFDTIKDGCDWYYSPMTGKERAAYLNNERVSIWR